MDWFTVLNNREWATLIWLSILVIWASSDKRIRTSFVGVIKAFLAKQILISLVLMATYISLLVFGLESVGLWDYSQFKDTVTWSIFVAAATLFDINTISKDDKYFRKAILDNFKASILVEYLVSTYVFSFPTELVIIPVAAFLGIMLSFSKTDKKYKRVESCLTVLTTILGLSIVAFVFYNAYLDLSNLASIKTATSFSSPIILSILFLPFIYIAMIYMKYETYYALLPIFIKDPRLLRYTKLQAALRCKFDLKMLNRFYKKVIHQRPNNKQDVLDLLRSSKSS